MPADARAATVDSVVLASDMLPERYVMAWYEAVWEGPAQRQQSAFCSFLDRMMDHGFGRVRKVLLGLVSPMQLATQASGLWRHDHDTGTLTLLPSSDDGGINLVLRDHVYTTTPLARLAIAEIYRYAVSLARGANMVTQIHSLDIDRSLRVRISVR